jgi:hypothetical protein
MVGVSPDVETSLGHFGAASPGVLGASPPHHHDSTGVPRRKGPSKGSPVRAPLGGVWTNPTLISGQ